MRTARLKDQATLKRPKAEQPSEEVADADQDETPDVLLVETGRILVDAITLRPNTSLAGREPAGASANNLQ